MTTDAQVNATKLHFEDNAYRKVDLPSSEKKITQFIAALTTTLEDKINNK